MKYFQAIFQLIRVVLRNGGQPVWLFGENLGATANNNSFYTWRHVVNRHNDAVRPYLILKRSPRNCSVVATFNPVERRYVIWRHSLAHAWLYCHAEMCFVTLSFKDVWPDCVRLMGLKKSFKPKKRCSLIYLEHGTEGIKALGYGPSYADNTLLRFVYYNPKIRGDLIEVNGFRPYQVLYGVYPPRYQELLVRHEKAQHEGGRRILWFLTWREYMGKNIDTYKLFARLATVLKSERFRDYMERTDSELTICLHQLCDVKCAMYRPLVDEACTARMKVVYAADIDVMDEIAAADVLITDYSSLGFDFTFLRKPVVLYASDLSRYVRGRKFYCTESELEGYLLRTPSALVDALVSQTYAPLHPFFSERMDLPNREDYEKVLAGDYIERLYCRFKALQDETYAFLGYDFSGVGGTVYATKALAEGLMEEGKRVVLYPLKNGGACSCPAGVLNRPLLDYTDGSRLARLKRKIFGRVRDYSYLRYDKDMPNLRPYCGWALKQLMRTIRARGVVSTRETMHFFLHDAESQWLKAKYYYFHCSAGLVDRLFPGTLERLKQRQLENALFVTARNRDLLRDMFGYGHYGRGVVTGNAVDSSRMITKDRIVPVEEKDEYHVMYLLRISEERWNDVERALSFVRYLKEKGQNRIKLDIYGKGDQALKLQYLLVDEELDEIAVYRGETRNIVATYESHDAMVDFSQSQSFGMGYIEAVFNGRVPFCRHNEGADEVLKDMPFCFFRTDEELEEKILSLPKITREELIENYEKLEKVYSRKAVADKFLS